MPDFDPYDPDQRHDDPAVQELISEGWLGVWDAPISVADLENAARIVRRAGQDREGLTMARLHYTAYMPAGTTITTEDGTATKRTDNPHGDPFPWHTDTGQYGNEWAAEQIGNGAAVTLRLVPYRADMLQDIAAGRVRRGRAEPHHVVVRLPIPLSVGIHVGELIRMGWCEVGVGPDPDWRPIVLTDVGRFVLAAHEARRAVTWQTCA